MDQTYDMTQASTWNPAFVTANGSTTAGAEAALVSGMAAGQAYLNIHTTTSPGGEIRGFPALSVPTLPGVMVVICALLLLEAGTLRPAQAQLDVLNVLVRPPLSVAAGIR